MSAEVIPIDAEQDAAWADYIAKRTRAEQTLDINDGIEAGRAWRRWIDLFLPREPYEGKIIQFERGNRK